MNAHPWEQNLLCQYNSENAYKAYLIQNLEFSKINTDYNSPNYLSTETVKIEIQNFFITDSLEKYILEKTLLNQDIKLLTPANNLYISTSSIEELKDVNIKVDLTAPKYNRFVIRRYFLDYLRKPWILRNFKQITL